MWLIYNTSTSQKQPYWTHNVGENGKLPDELKGIPKWSIACPTVMKGMVSHYGMFEFLVALCDLLTMVDHLSWLCLVYNAVTKIDKIVKKQ